MPTHSRTSHRRADVGKKGRLIPGACRNSVNTLGHHKGRCRRSNVRGQVDSGTHTTTITITNTGTTGWSKGKHRHNGQKSARAGAKGKRGTVSLNHQTVERDAGEKVCNVSAASGVADEAGDADVKPTRHVFVDFLASPREAVHAELDQRDKTTAQQERKGWPGKASTTKNPNFESIVFALIRYPAKQTTNNPHPSSTNATLLPSPLSTKKIKYRWCGGVGKDVVDNGKKRLGRLALVAKQGIPAHRQTRGDKISFLPMPPNITQEKESPRHVPIAQLNEKASLHLASNGKNPTYKTQDAITIQLSARKTARSL